MATLCFAAFGDGAHCEAREREKTITGEQGCSIYVHIYEPFLIYARPP